MNSMVATQSGPDAISDDVLACSPCQRFDSVATALPGSSKEHPAIFGLDDVAHPDRIPITDLFDRP